MKKKFPIHYDFRNIFSGRNVFRNIDFRVVCLQCEFIENFKTKTTFLQISQKMQNLEDEISKTAIFSRRGFGGKRKSKTEIDEKSLFKKLMKR